MKTQILIAVALLAMLARSASADQGKPMTWNIDGDKRQAWVFAPPVEGNSEKHPLIFAFHGHSENEKDLPDMADKWNFQQGWPEAIVVYPLGLPGPPVVNDQNRPSTGRGWQRFVGDQGDRDLKFFDRMLETLRQKFPVDNQRIYAVGFSNGAYFTYVLWSARATTLAAIGAVAGAVIGAPGSPDVLPIPLTHPLPVMHIAGLMDDTVLLEWQAETIAIDRKANNALNKGESCGDCCVLFSSSSQTPVRAVFFSGGHTYPYTWATAEFVTFFKSHSRT